MSHTIYTREQLSDMTESQLDLIYTELVGYPVIAESEGLETKDSAIELILGHQDEDAKNQPAPVQVSQTKGPWHINDGYPYVVHGKSPYPVCDLQRMKGDKEVKKANARLIALAPEMLEALKLAKTELVRLHADNKSGSLWTVEAEKTLADLNSLLSRAK